MVSTTRFIAYDVQQKCLSATTSPLCVLKGPLRHVRSTAADLPLARSSLYSGHRECLLAVCCRLSAVRNCTSFSCLSARLLMFLLASSVHHNCRRLLDAEGWRWHQASRNVASTSCFCSIGVARSFACFSRQLWNRKSACCPSWPAEKP